MPFFCAICEEESTRICVRCTKDTCSNHICERCGRCSDCCECEVSLEQPVREPARSVMPQVMVHPVEPSPVPAAVAEPQPEPGLPQPPPDPDPVADDQPPPPGPAQA